MSAFSLTQHSLFPIRDTKQACACSNQQSRAQQTFSVEPNNNYLRLCRPYGLCGNYSTPHYSTKADVDDTHRHGCVPVTFYLKECDRLNLAWGHSVLVPALEYGRSDAVGLLRVGHKRPHSFHLVLLEVCSQEAPSWTLNIILWEAQDTERGPMQVLWSTAPAEPSLDVSPAQVPAGVKKPPDDSSF